VVGGHFGHNLYLTLKRHKGKAQQKYSRTSLKTSKFQGKILTLVLITKYSNNRTLKEIGLPNTWSIHTIMKQINIVAF